MNSIHPSAIIGPNVRLGDQNTVGPYAILAGSITVGSGNWIGAGAKLGVPPEVRSFVHDENWLAGQEGAGLEIGDNNIIREDAQIHSGWRAATRIGSRTFLMNQVYVAHDCEVQDDVTLASGVAVGGHARIGRQANIGLHTAVHQGRIIGAFAMIGMSAVVTRDVPPFVKAFGSPCRVTGINDVGMRRAQIADAVITQVADAIAAGDSLDGIRAVAGFGGDVDWYNQAVSA